VRTVAVLPVKSFGAAKQRLSATVAPGDRRELAEAMVSDVLDALGAVAGLDAIVVVTAEPLAAQAARAAGAMVVDDPSEAGQSAAAMLGVDAAVAGGAQRVLLVPGDCPALDPREVEELLTRDIAVVVVPDRHGTGTNALLLAPPDAIEPAFGPGSFERHIAAGLGRVEVAEVPSLGLDVDTADDLVALEAALARRSGGAQRTRARLQRLAA
jgi:2-phospho-L-lactate guanylyltransferase